MGVVENMKDFADLVKKVGDADLYRQIVKLEGEVIDLTREKRRAEEKVEELENALLLKEKLTFVEPFWWLENDDAPYCAGCWEQKHLAIHAVQAVNNDAVAIFDCPVCETRYHMTGIDWRNLKRQITSRKR